MSGRVDEGLPVAVSCVRGYKNFDPKAVGLSEKVDVLLDGRVLDEVSGWDAEAGTVLLPVYNSDGSRILDKNGAPAFGSRRGRVEVRWIKQEQPA